jgi:hypothetical protein
MKWISLEHAKANLVEFLKDYSETFNENNLNPSCDKCLERYFNNFKNLNKMENTCKYKLHEKYNGIQLDFGSNVFVTNDNITDKLALQLIKNKGAHLFAEIPESPEPEEKSEKKPKAKKDN